MDQQSRQNVANHLPKAVERFFSGDNPTVIIISLGLCSSEQILLSRLLGVILEHRQEEQAEESSSTKPVGQHQAKQIE